jgi:hypothetical protein
MILQKLSIILELRVVKFCFRRANKFSGAHQLFFNRVYIPNALVTLISTANFS